jgi:MFS family permease
MWTVLAARFGNAAVLFWSMVLTLAVNVWSAYMTGAGDYNAFVVSRLIAGLFGSAPTTGKFVDGTMQRRMLILKLLTVGANIIVQVFFLHDRGKCFAIYTSLILFGTVASNTFSGFIVQSAAWPVQFWYNVALEGVIAILCLLLLDETGWTRPGGDIYPTLPDGFFARKLATYTLLRRVTPRKTARETSYRAVLPFLIGLSPVTIIVGIAVMICFSWSVAINTFLALFLQEPVGHGGYGFSPLQNAACMCTQFLALIKD